MLLARAGADGVVPMFVSNVSVHEQPNVAREMRRARGLEAPHRRLSRTRQLAIVAIGSVRVRGTAAVIEVGAFSASSPPKKSS